jgi:hypothetical protein
MQSDEQVIDEQEPPASGENYVGCLVVVAPATLQWMSPKALPREARYAGAGI